MTSIAFIGLFALALLGMVAYLPYGILSWLWFILQIPHQMIQVTLPLNMAIVVACGLGAFFNRKQGSLWIDGTMLLLAVLVAHSGITTMTGFSPEYSYPYFDRLWKTIALGVAIAVFMQNRTRIQAMIWVSVVSIGTIAAKGAAFVILTAGAYRIWGPPSSQIEDNNHLAGVLCMVIPFGVYLYQTSSNPLVRRGLVVLIGTMLATVLFTYSRTGLLALLSVGFSYWLMAKTRHKVTLAVIAVLIVAIGVPLMPQKWLDRMQTITETIDDTSKADESMRARFEAWSVYYAVGMERPLLGQGFRAPELRALWVQHVPNWPLEAGGRAAHNNVLQVLGEHGVVGLLIYGMMILLALKNASAIMMRTRHIAELRWARLLATATTISLVAYLTAGLTISIPYYDLFIINLVLLSLLRRLVIKTIAEIRPTNRFTPAVQQHHRPVPARP